MVSVSLYPFRQIVWPELHPRLASAAILIKPLIVEFVDNKESHLVAKLHERLAVRVVRHANMVESEILEQRQSLLHSTRISSCTKSSERMVVSNTLQNNLLTIEFETEFRRILYCSDTKCVGRLIHNFAHFIEDFHLCGVEIRILTTPQLRIVYHERVKSNFVRTVLAVDASFFLTFVNHFAVLILHDSAHRNYAALRAIHHLCLNLHNLVVLSCDIQRMACKVYVWVGNDKCHITEESATSVPTRIDRTASIGTNSKDIFLAIFQFSCHVNLKTNISVVRSADAFTVQVYIAHVHNPLEVNEYTLSLERRIRSVRFHIPSRTHLLKSASRQTAFKV